jgi:hypothetical protein
MAPAEVGVGRRNDSFGWWIYHSNARVLFSSSYLFTTFYSMTTNQRFWISDMWGR